MTQVAKDRDWVVMRAEFATEDDFRAAVVDELARLENMGHRLGLGFTMTSIRQRADASGVTVNGDEHVFYETVGWLFRAVFMPAVRPMAPVEPLAHELLGDAELEPEPVGS